MKNGIARSPMFYVGDKYKLIREIRTHFPQHIGRLIEPFVGGGSVMMNVVAESYLLNDINEYVIKADFIEGGQQDMKRLYLLLIYGFNHMLRFNGQGLFNLPVGNVDFNKNVHDALEDYFMLLSQKDTEWHNEDYRNFLNEIDYQPDDLVYLDPPYLITFSEYNKLWNEETERDLLELLDNLNDRGVKFAISNVTHYRGRVNDIFLEWSRQYNVHSIKSNYISFNDNSIKQFSEVLVTNY